MLPPIEEIARSVYISAMDAVRIIDDLSSRKELNAEDIDTVGKNLHDLKVILEASFWTSEDLTPFRNAILAAEETINKNTSMMSSLNNDQKTYIAPEDSAPLSNAMITLEALKTGSASLPAPAPGMHAPKFATR